MYTNLMKKYEKSTYEHNYDIKFKQKQLREKESMEEKETWVGSYPKQRAKKKLNNSDNFREKRIPMIWNPFFVL